MGSTRNWVINPPGKKPNWGSIEFSPEGKSIHTRAQKIAARMTRYGRRVKLYPTASVPMNGLERKLLAEVEQKIAALKVGKTHSKKLGRLEAAQKVLTTSLELQTHLGRTPSTYHVLASLGLVYGFNSAEIESVSRHMVTAQVHHAPITWVGTVNRIRRALKMKIDSKGNNFVTGIEGHMFKVRKPLTSRELSEQLKIPWEGETRDIVNSSLQLLETAGLVKKMPGKIDLRTDKEVSMWVHKEYAPTIKEYEFGVGSKKHYLSPAMEILNHLLDGPKLTTELYHNPDKSKRTQTRTTMFTNISILNRLTQLQAAGLIEIETVRMPKMGGVKIREAKLTGYGKELWLNSLKTGVLSERLRLLLIGEVEGA